MWRRGEEIDSTARARPDSGRQPRVRGDVGEEGRGANFTSPLAWTPAGPGCP